MKAGTYNNGICQKINTIKAQTCILKRAQGVRKGAQGSDPERTGKAPSKQQTETLIFKYKKRRCGMTANEATVNKRPK